MNTITYSQETSDAIQAMHDAINRTEAARLEGKPYAGKGELLDLAKEAVKTANNAIIKDAVTYFQDMAKEDMAKFVAAYWNDWTVDGYAVVQDAADQGGEIHSEGRTMRIPYSSIDTMANKLKLSSNAAWRKYLAIYADNCMAWIAENDKGEKALSVKNALPFELVQKRKELGGAWEKHSHAALVAQLNDITKMIFPEGMKPDFYMVSVDQKAVTAQLAKGKKQEANGATTLQMANLATLERILFFQVYTRMNNLAINLETGLKEKKNADKAQPKKGEAKGGDVSAPKGDVSAPKAAKEDTAA